MDTEIKNQKTFGGLRANAAAFLVNLSFLIPGLGIIFSLISLILEKENRFVRSYSKQTLIISVILLLGASTFAVKFVGGYIFYSLLIITNIFQIVAAIAALLEKELKIPYIEKVIDLFFID